MRFRMVHLLTVIALCAVFAAALAKPESYWKTLIPLGAWLAYAAIACRAVSCREGRQAMFGALIFGLSYLGMAFWWRQAATDLPTNHLLTAVHGLIGRAEIQVINGRTFPANYEGYFVIIGHIAFSFVFALIGGALGAYWSRSQSQATKE
jgi:hypothetical protein